MIPARVSGSGRSYAGDKLERLYVHVTKSEARGLPYREGEQVPVTVVAGGTEYKTTLNARANYPNLFLATDFVDAGGSVHKQTHVLHDLGLGKNDRLQLSVAGQRITLVLVTGRGAGPQTPAVPAPTPVPASAEVDVSVAEGRERLRSHRIRERNRALIALKKRRVLAESGRLECEACDFDFAAVYGPRGDGFAECHHTHPISQSAPGRQTRLSELAVVCSNCHRMLHRRPWISVAELRELVQSRRGG